MALSRVLAVLIVVGLAGMASAARADDTKQYDLDGCAVEIVAAFRPLLAQRRVRPVEPPTAAMGLIASSTHCALSPELRTRATALLQRPSDALTEGDLAEPEEEWLRELAFSWGMPRARGAAREVVLRAAREMVAHSQKAVPLVQALWVMANFDYRGPETPDGVPIVGDVLLEKLAPGCGYGQWFTCPEGHMRWHEPERARVRRWYFRRGPH